MTIDEYLMLLQQTQQNPQLGATQMPQQMQQDSPNAGYENINPITQGSIAGINAARESLSTQKEPMGFGKQLGNALSQGLQNVGVGLLRGDSHPVLQQIGSAMQTPQERMKQQYEQNMQLVAQMEASKRAQQHWEHSQAVLAEQKRQHDMMAPQHEAHTNYYNMMSEKAKKDMMKEEQIEQETEKLNEEHPGAISYKGRTAAERSAFTKELRERANKPSTEIKVLNTLDKINEIVKDYPDLSKSASAAMFPGKYKGGIADTVKLRLMDHKKRVALEKLTKLSNDLVIKQVHGLGGQRASIFLERIMQASNPHHGLTPEAIEAIRDNFKEEYDKSFEDGKMARKALHGNYYVPMMEPEYGKKAQDALKTPDISSMSNEELLRLAQ
jgi:hypothetical protein